MSIQDEASVEFHLPAADALGRLDVDGKVRFAEGKLFVHWKLRDRTFTRTQNKLRTAELAPGDIEGVVLDNGWFSTTLRVEAKDPRLLDDMPGVEMGKLAIKLSRSQRKDAEKLVSVVDYAVSQWQADHSRRRMLGLEEEAESTAAAEEKEINE